MAQSKGKFDIALEKLISRKLFVFFLTVIFMLMGKVDEQSFMQIAMVYIGGQALVDMLANYRKAGASNEGPPDAS